MKPSKKLFYILVVGALIFCLPQGSLAAGKSPASDLLTKEGKDLYEKGNRSEAIKSFSKALLVNPGNEEARSFLKEMGVDGGIYNRPLPPPQQILRLKGEVRNQKEKITGLERDQIEQTTTYKQIKNDLTSKNQSLQEKLESEKGKVENLDMEVHVVKSNLKQQTARNKKIINHLKDYSKEQDRQVDLLMRMTKKHLGVIDDKDDAIASKGQRIKDLSQHIVLVKRQSLKEISSHEKRMYRKLALHKEKIADLRREARRIGRTKEKYKKRSHLCETRLQEFDQNLRVQEDKVDELETALLSKDLELFRKEKDIRRKEDALDSANDELAYINRTIEKNPEMDRLFAVDQQDEILNRIDLLKQKDKDIAVLKEKLVNAIKKIKVLENSSQGADSKKAQALRREMDRIRNDLKRREDSLDEKNTEYNILEERLMDAKERLDFVEKIIEEKDEQIDGLKSELIQIRDKCVE